MKEKYIELMEKALSAYTDEHIQRYLNDVKTNGLTEHGFPRLTSNIGILIAHGRRTYLLPTFIEMMSLCCRMFLRPYVHSANEFSVREVLCCIAELEAKGTVDAEIIAAWKRDLAAIEPEKCYNSYEKALSNRARNWAFFLATSELFRQNAGLCESAELIDSLIEQQMQWFDENGMYQDNKYAQGCHQPIMYDIVTRGLCVLLLHFGYRGRYREQIDRHLKKAALMTLQMQSPNGEMAFGGRSNQYILCEGWQAQIFEFEANRYAAMGDMKTASAFKRAAVDSAEVCERWLSRSPISHIKNRFPSNSLYGCEGYGYFDKYMITVASNCYVAYLMCNEDIPAAKNVDRTPYILTTSNCFHKLFIGNSTYQLEFDLNADPEYDANGLGRVHRDGAPSTICLSCPCPSEPNYTVDVARPFAFSMCSAIRTENGWHFGASSTQKYEILESETTADTASATLLCRFENGNTVRERYTVNENGVSIMVEGNGEIGYTLPAFCFDGEITPEIITDDHSMTISYEGWVCRYTTNGTIINLNRTAANRNGHYQAFLAIGEEEIHVNIELIKQK